MWRSIGRGRISSGAPRTGRIRACARILRGATTGFVRVRPLLDRAPHFDDLPDGEADDAGFVRLRRSALIGRPLGSAGFVAEIEQRLGRALATAKPGRKPRDQAIREQ